MRVLQVVTAFPRSEADVISPWLVQLIKRLQAQKVDVEVFTSAYRGGGGGSFEGIRVHRFRYFLRRYERLTHEESAPDRMRRSPLYRVMPAFYVASGLLAIWRLCRRERYDVVHVHWPLPHFLFGWCARRVSGARIVSSFHGVELRLVKGPLPVLRRFVGWAARSSDRVVANSSYTAREVRELAPVRVDVIPFSVGFPPDDRTRKMPARGDSLEILSVGRLVERKGNSVLIRAFAALPASLDARLVIIGEGPEREHLVEEARSLGVLERVEFRGRVTEAELKEAYRSASAFVLPAVVDSRGDTEGLGVVLLEAMSYGVPVIASAVGGITDVVIDGESGALVPPGDAGALAAAIRTLLEGGELAGRLGRGGLLRVTTHFSWEAVVSRWSLLYAELASST